MLVVVMVVLLVSVTIPEVSVATVAIINRKTPETNETNHARKRGFCVVCVARSDDGEGFAVVASRLYIIATIAIATIM